MEEPLPPSRHNLLLRDRDFLPLRAEIPRRAEHRHCPRRALVPAHGVWNGDSVARRGTQVFGQEVSQGRACQDGVVDLRFYMYR